MPVVTLSFGERALKCGAQKVLELQAFETLLKVREPLFELLDSLTNLCYIPLFKAISKSTLKVLRKYVQGRVWKAWRPLLTPVPKPALRFHTLLSTP